MERSRMIRTGVLRPHQENQAVGLKKRLNKNLATLDPNSGQDRKAITKQASITVNNSSNNPKKFVLIPKQLPPAIIDVDGEKSDNYLNCPYLAPSQYHYLFKVEEKYLNAPNYLSHTNINVLQRQRVIDWMTILHSKFCDVQETLFIAVNYFDRYLAACTVSNEQLQIVAATALYTASKFEEIYAIPIGDLCAVAEDMDTLSITPLSVRKTELELLRVLKFRMNPPLKNHFLRRCSMAAGATVELHVSSKFLIEASMYDPDLASSVAPSLVAATASYIALSLFGKRTRKWDATMVFHSGHSEAEITPIVPRLAAIVSLLCNGSSSFHVVRKWADIISNKEFARWMETSSS